MEDHFADVGKMIEIGKGGRREVDETLLSRYACYLIIQNSDPKKEIVVLREYMRRHNMPTPGARGSVAVVRTRNR